MLTDVVIDTNVLAHAGAPGEARRADAMALVSGMLASSVLLCVDPGFSMTETENRSFIGLEYIQHLRYGTPGYHLVVTLALSSRIRICEKRGSQAQTKKIQQLIRKPRDRTFVGVACNSQSRTLVSHDFEDFQQKKRRDIKSDIGVSILAASEIALNAG